jgi:ComF family protein
MLNIASSILDFIFPPRATERCVRNISNSNSLFHFSLNTHESIHYLLSYKDENVRSLIHENKYYGNTLAAAHLAKVLDLWVDSRSNESIIFIPIPLSAQRKKSRGYNQVEQILKRLSTHQQVTVATDVLYRGRNTAAQTTLQKADRLKNMKDAFVYNSVRLPIDQGTVVLIDDVVTTGATLKAAKASLAPHLSPTTSLICLALAH